jgi:hypothetical protein
MSENYQYLLDKGCTTSGHGIRCNFLGCSQEIHNFADMSRHMLVHFSDPFMCLGCPTTFLRDIFLGNHSNRSRVSVFHADRSTHKSYMTPIETKGKYNVFE